MFDNRGEINNKNHLVFAGCDTVDIAKKYGTPLYVYDVAKIRSMIRLYKNALKEVFSTQSNVLYASKALSIKAIYKILKEEKIGCDVVSLGEMYTAKSAGFNLSNAYFHGNNKQDDEIEYAIKNNIGRIVIDNLDEIDVVDNIAKKLKKKQDVLIRVNPGIKAKTHTFIQTSNVDSKFGFYIEFNDLIRAILKTIEKKHLNFKGFHIHIGSQIFDTEGYFNAIHNLITFLKAIKEKYNVVAEEIDLGGGFAIRYTEDDQQEDENALYNKLISILQFAKKEFVDNNLDIPFITLEPGRSIVGAAGITLYTVGYIKEIEKIKKYVNIDGGMGDNIRPALYDADYQVTLANKISDKKTEKVTITGKYCESGDIIVQSTMLQKVEKGDILCVYSTGAYNYSMASNYNRNLIPAVVFIENKKPKLVVKRQTLDDLIKNDL